MKACPVCRNSYPADFTVCPRDASLLVEVGLWREGAVLRGRYRILGKIGEGGMGSVYKAEHTHFQEIRALKVMRADLASDPLFVSRFRQEAVISRKLQHPNAVRVEDIDEAEDGRPFIVMEFIEGRSLKDVIRDEAPMPVSRTCGILKQVAGALDAAHSLGIVHRDIKPANIVLIQTASGEQVKVLDFGIAKLKEGYLQDNTSQTTLTGTGMVVGTPAYISPEQAVGKRGQQLDGRADLYSLGIVAFQMLTGDLPFKADSDVGFAVAHLQSVPPSVRDLRPAVPVGVSDVVMRCLEKSPDGRPANARQFAELLEREEAREVGPAFSAPPAGTSSRLESVFEQPTRTSVLAPPPAAPGEQVKFSTPAPSQSKVMSAKKRELLLYLGGSAVALVLLAIAGYYVFFEQGATEIGAQSTTEQHAPAVQAPPPVPNPGANTGAKDTGVPAAPPTDAASGTPSAAQPGPKEIQPVASVSDRAKSDRLRVSRGVSEGMVIDRVQPAYPPLARAAHVQGLVLLDAHISKDGTIESLQLIQGHPLLAPAAIDAVKKWRYKPYMKNGKPISVETEIAVNFRLTSN